MPYPPNSQMAGSQPLSNAAMYALAMNAGWVGQNIDIAVAVAKAESGWIVNNVNKSSGASGLWQVLPSAHPQYDVAKLRSDGAYNAAAAFAISGGGTTWKPWVAYTSGAYRKYLTATAEQGQLAQVLGVPSITGGEAKEVPPSQLYKLQGLGGVPVQPAFDPRMQYPSGPFASAATKGQIIGQTDPAKNYVVKFLYNPSSIMFDYSVDTNIKDPTQQDLSQMLVGLPQGTATSITFQLYFDRTFECRGGSQVGVLGDIRALEHLCGIGESFPYMMPNRVKLMFGAPLQLTWNATLTNFQVEYTHFNSAMIPMRCIVGVKALRMGPEPFLGKDDPLLAPPPKSPSGPVGPKFSGKQVGGKTTAVVANTISDMGFDAVIFGGGA